MKDHNTVNGNPETRWTQYYILAGHWKADLEFYCEDLQFLHHLVDKYLLWITKPDNLAKAKTIEKDLYTLKTSCDNLFSKIDIHRNKLGRLVDNPLGGGDALAIETHGELEEELAGFVKRFRANRREVFKITEYILDSEALPIVSH
jgi:hypothetical protein